MDRKIKVMYGFIIFIILLIVGLLLLVYSNKKNINNDSTDDKDNDVTWVYMKHEIRDENGNYVDSSFNFDAFYLVFHEDTVDVCYNDCYTTKYYMDGEYITIDYFESSGSVFSGTYRITSSDDIMMLYDGEDGGYSILYYFGKPIDE